VARNYFLKFLKVKNKSMENVTMQPKENLSVATFDPAKTYANASQLQLSESEMKALSAPFEDLEYEITPQGFIYLPQSISLQRLNTVLGVGRWGLILINTGSQQMKEGLVKVFYDGALIIRGCFVSRAAGEASYSSNNNNQSYASALEAAKSDCRQRCCKDLGIANDAWNPTFTRRWQKEHAVKVWVDKNGQKIPLWRRKDLDPYPNEIGIVVSTPHVQGDATDAPKQQIVTEELPWLNHGPEYDAAIKELLEGKTISSLRKKYRISKSTGEALLFLLQKEWAMRLDTCKTIATLSESYNLNEAEVKEYPWLKDMFSNRRDLIKNGKVKV
jgi:Mitochondrial genome maintenance MGM101